MPNNVSRGQSQMSRHSKANLSKAEQGLSLATLETWPLATNRRDMMCLTMRASDHYRLQPFARTKMTAARDFKWAAQLVELIEALDVTPREFVAASRYFEVVVFGENRQGYGQTWPNFCKHFEAIVAEIRRGMGKTREEMILERNEEARQEESRRTLAELEDVERAPADVASRYAAEIRRRMHGE